MKKWDDLGGFNPTIFGSTSVNTSLKRRLHTCQVAVKQTSHFQLSNFQPSILQVRNMSVTIGFRESIYVYISWEVLAFGAGAP